MKITADAIPGLPEIAPGDDLAALAATALAAAPGGPPADGDVLVLAQKVVSKSEGLYVDLRSVRPSPLAERIAGEDGRDPRRVQGGLDEAREVLRRRGGVMICETRHGFVCANAGVDASNVPGDETVLLLPRDPDGSARDLRARLQRLLGVRLGVIVTDSFGRPWRIGQTDVAIGCAGVSPVADARGQLDREGRTLAVTEMAVADEIAAASDLTRGKASGEPLVLVRGCERFVTAEDGPGAARLLRERSQDLFR